MRLSHDPRYLAGRQFPAGLKRDSAATRIHSISARSCSVPFTNQTHGYLASFIQAPQHPDALPRLHPTTP